ncbi:hypothetical protein, partial [Bacteroides cellulosilyticus]|uniref:hypothetical protein n=1 Tax=Bacteroides cellulosilyticus TaxID=246787 RepID=UPI0018AC2256
FNTGNSVCVLDPGKIKAIILTIHGHKLPETYSAEEFEKACHADRPDRIFPLKTIVEYAPSGGEAQTSALGYGPTKVTSYSAKNDVWTLSDYDFSLKANLMAAKNVAFDAYFVDENNIIYGMNDGTGELAGIPLSGVYPGGQDWDSSGTEANLTVATMFKDYEKYIKNANIKACDFDVVEALKGLVYVEMVKADGDNKYKLREHYGNLDVTEYYGSLIADKAATVLPGATGVSYEDGVITATGTVKLAKPSILQANGITGIEAWS